MRRERDRAGFFGTERTEKKEKPLTEPGLFGTSVLEDGECLLNRFTSWQLRSWQLRRRISW
jgi:hypothetical protein